MDRYCLIIDDDGYYYVLPVSLADEFEARNTEIEELLVDTIYHPKPESVERFDALVAAFNNDYSQYRLEKPANLTFTDPQVDGEPLYEA